MKKIVVQNLCIVYKYPKILLGMKKRGFGAGRWNGFGGKVKDGEKIEEAAKRELKEEISINASEMEKVGVINFEFTNSDEMPEVHFFQVKKWSGEPEETEEMKPQWFDIKNTPYDLMWPDDKFWLPLFLEGKKFKGKFLFGDYNKIIKHKIETVEKL